LQVRVRCGGICASDLHDYGHGGFGTIRIQEPMVLGREVAGVIEAVGASARGFAVGERIELKLLILRLTPRGLNPRLPDTSTARDFLEHQIAPCRLGTGLTSTSSASPSWAG
jgi:hypothetical protein